jgi:hypothetical protein
MKFLLFRCDLYYLGEFPVNAKEFWKELSNKEVKMEHTRFAVFAMGDRNYWPRPEDYIYFCKPGTCSSSPPPPLLPVFRSFPLRIILAVFKKCNQILRKRFGHEDGTIRSIQIGRVWYR